MAPVAQARIIADLAGRDPALARYIEQAGPLEYPPRSADGPFAALVRAIVFQQLAGTAARAIEGRLVAAAGGTVSPAALLALGDADLRQVGLSGNKVLAVRDLAGRVEAGVLDLAEVQRSGEDEATAALVAVRGIGPWTAKIFLMFEMHRLDVWPVEDLGVRAGYRIIWALPATPAPKALVALGEPLRPYRSVAALYCWHAAAAATGQPTVVSRRDHPAARRRPDA
jgi:DNA-3-methyladenine glycosylase II